METMTIAQYLELYDQDYKWILVNKNAVRVNPLGGTFHLDRRKVVDCEAGTVTLYDLDEEAE